MKELFSLQKWNMFKLATSDEIFTVEKYAWKNRPQIGKTLHLIAFDTKGKEAWFIRNMSVEIIKGDPND